MFTSFDSNNSNINSSIDYHIAKVVLPFTMTPEARLLNTMQAVEHVVKNNIEGAIVECGVWRGGNIMAAALKLNSLGVVDREIYLYDTFEGMSNPTAKDIGPTGELASNILSTQPKNTDNHYWAFTPLDTVKSNVFQTGYPESNFRFVVGKVEDTIPQIMPNKIAVLRLDTDWYESTKHELENLFDLIMPGGVLIVDDFGFWKGSREAVEEFWAKLSPKPELMPVDDTAVYCVKPDNCTIQGKEKKVAINKTNSSNDLAKIIEEQEYLRERLNPKKGDPLYVHLVDLRNAMEQVALSKDIKILDFGCGGSPYKSLFPNSDYKRADYLSTDGLDYIVSENSTIEEKDETFDLIISTQVLEHVKNPNTYLQECYRLLKPNGNLVLTTHGTYEDHGCPFDFQRWTADGLKVAVENNGFIANSVKKLTTGSRAVMFMLELYRNRFPMLPNDPLGNAISGLLNFINTEREYFHSWCDSVFPSHQIVEGENREHAFYLTLMLTATKKML